MFPRRVGQNPPLTRCTLQPHCGAVQSKPECLQLLNLQSCIVLFIYTNEGGLHPLGLQLLSVGLQGQPSWTDVSTGVLEPKVQIGVLIFLPTPNYEMKLGVSPRSESSYMMCLGGRRGLITACSLTPEGWTTCSDSLLGKLSDDPCLLYSHIFHCPTAKYVGAGHRVRSWPERFSLLRCMAVVLKWA